MEDYIPEEFRITLGSFHGRNYTFVLRDRKITYFATRPDEKIVRDPAQDDWSKFWRKTISEKIWLWKKSYVNWGSNDGHNWSVSMSIGKMKMHSYGSGDYPDNFKEFLKLLSKLTGGLEINKT